MRRGKHNFKKKFLGWLQKLKGKKISLAIGSKGSARPKMGIISSMGLNYSPKLISRLCKGLRKKYFLIKKKKKSKIIILNTKLSINSSKGRKRTTRRR